MSINKNVLFSSIAGELAVEIASIKNADTQAKETYCTTKDRQKEQDFWRKRLKEIRSRTGYSQERFSEIYGINLSTLRKWEQGETVPDKTAQTLVGAIDKAPDAMEDLCK